MLKLCLIYLSLISAVCLGHHAHGRTQTNKDLRHIESELNALRGVVGDINVMVAQQVQLPINSMCSISPSHGR